jgi:hypothetical protein
MKNALLFCRNFFRKVFLLIFLLTLPGMFTLAQTVYTDYQDGKIYFKFKDDVTVDFPVKADNTVEINSIPFISALSSEFSLKELSRPFYTNNDFNYSGH